MEHYGIELFLNLEKRDDEKYTMRGSFYRNEKSGEFTGVVFDYYHGTTRQIYGKMGKVVFNLYFCNDDLGMYGVGGFSARVESDTLNFIYYPDGFDGRAYFVRSGMELIKLSNRRESKTYKRFNDNVFANRIIPFKNECTPDNGRIIYDLWLEDDYSPVYVTGRNDVTEYVFDHEEILAIKEEEEPEPELDSNPEIGVRGDPGYDYI